MFVIHIYYKLLLITSKTINKPNDLSSIFYRKKKNHNKNGKQQQQQQQRYSL